MINNIDGKVCGKVCAHIEHATLPKSPPAHQPRSCLSFVLLNFYEDLITQAWLLID